MPFYQYECKDCLFTEEVIQSIKDSPLKCCPSCKNESYRRVISIDYTPHCSVKNYNTIGSLADKNWKKMGQYEKDKKLKESNIEKIKETKEYNKKMNKIGRMSLDQQKKYIERGDV